MKPQSKRHQQPPGLIKRITTMLGVVRRKGCANDARPHLDCLKVFVPLDIPAAPCHKLNAVEKTPPPGEALRHRVTEKLRCSSKHRRGKIAIHIHFADR